MSEDKGAEGCVAKAAGPVVPESSAPSGQDESTQNRSQSGGEDKMNVTVGKQAPDFEASAYHEGGFKNIKLSNFRGKWVFLCFYPGDFTFV
jgi:hypothetical protein